MDIEIMSKLQDAVYRWLVKNKGEEYYKFQHDKLIRAEDDCEFLAEDMYESVIDYILSGWTFDKAVDSTIEQYTDDYITVDEYEDWCNVKQVVEQCQASSRAMSKTMETNDYVKDGNYIWFGEYPQTIKASGITVDTTADSRGYYLGSDGYYYAKITSRPCENGYTFSTGGIVSSGTVYCFKVEPIKWRILSESNGEALILCESIIANKRYNMHYMGEQNGVYANNYANSEIRAWLNNEFYNTAFTSLQQELILVTNVDNSVYSTGYSSNPYACANTNDKIFLPSYRDMTNTSYGFSSSEDSLQTRERLISDYSRATGAYIITNSAYCGKGNWWLRSPDISYCDNARNIYSDGIIYSINVYYTNIGVVPALKIKILGATRTQSQIFVNQLTK